MIGPSPRSSVRRPVGRAALMLALAVSPAAALAQGTPSQGTPAQTPAQTPAAPGLSLDEAVVQAHRNNPDFLAQANDVRTARAASRAARAEFLPSASAASSFGYTAKGQRRLSYSLSRDEPDYYSSGYSLGLSYDLDGAKLAQPSIARAQENAARQKVAGAEANLTAQVAQQYLTVLQAQEQVAAAEREVASTGEHERLAKARLEVGAGTPLDVRRAEVQRGQAEVKLLQNRNQVAIAMLQLGQLMGTSLDPSVRLSTAFELEQPHWSADSLAALALSNNPGLRAARASASAAHTGIRSARSSYFPTMSLDVGWNGSMYRPGDLNGLVRSQVASAQQQLANCQQGNALAALLHQSPQDCSQYAFTEAEVRQQVLDANSGYPFRYTRQPMNAQLTFRLPIFTGLSRQQRVEEARVQAEDAEYQVRAQELKLRVDIGTALRNLETAYQTAQLQEQVVQRATEELRLARERFRLGAGTSVEVSDAQTSVAQAEQGRIDAVYNFHKSLALLESMVGQRLR